MLKKIRLTFTLILVFVLAFSFAGCKNNGSSGDDSDDYSQHNPVPEDLAGELVITSYNAKYTALLERELNSIKNRENDNDLFMFVQTFKSQYPGIDIELDSTLSYSEYFATIDQRIEKGQTGDVVLISSEKIPEYVEKGWIVDLSDYASSRIDYTSSTFNRLYPSNIIMDSAYKASIYNGRLYMCPVEYINKVVILNLDMLREAGIENPVPPDGWTWDDVISYAQILKEKGIEKPILMDYTDYSIWGSFAQGFGGALSNDVSVPQKKNELNFADPDVIKGILYLAENFIRTGLVDDIRPASVQSDDLSKYGIIVADHSDVIRWENILSSDAENGGFDWEFAHFPGFLLDDGTVNKSIGARTLGFAVLNRQKIESDLNGGSDVDKTDEEIKEEEEAMANTLKNAKILALYAMVKDASVAYCGEKGFKVPALISAGDMKFWREYPVSGKNTSVFSLYSKYDFPAILTNIMSWNASTEIKEGVADILSSYKENSGSIPIEDLIQKIQDAANAN